MDTYYEILGVSDEVGQLEFGECWTNSEHTSVATYKPDHWLKNAHALGYDHLTVDVTIICHWHTQVNVKIEKTYYYSEN